MKEKQLSLGHSNKHKNIKMMLDYLNTRSDVELIEKIHCFVETLFLECYSGVFIRTKRDKNRHPTKRFARSFQN